MPLSDLPMSILFSIFLLIFVLLGVNPSWKKTAARIRRLLREREKSSGSGPPEGGSKPGTRPGMLPGTRPLNDFEVFVIRQLALAGARGLSRSQLIAELHFEPAIVKQALGSLVARGLLSVGLSFLLRIRYFLSAAGHDYAAERGYLPTVH